MTRTYHIPASRKAALSRRLDSIRRRADKLGVIPISYSFGATSNVAFIRSAWDGSWVKFTGTPEALRQASEACRVMVVPHVEITITGSAPKLEGWTLVAILQHLQDDNGPRNIVRTIPGEDDVPERFRTSRSVLCEHCHKQISRSATYVLRNVDGTYLQVGSTCLGDFTGAADPFTATAGASLLIAAAEACETSGNISSLFAAGGRSTWNTTQFLAAVLAVLRNDRWISRTSARDTYRTSTADTAIEILHGLDNGTVKDAYRPTEEDEERAETMLAYVAGLEPTSDYEHNLATLASLGWVDSDTAGYAASIATFYQRKVEEAEIRASSTTYLGEVGTRVNNIYGALRKVSTYTGDYGVTYTYSFVTKDGLALRWQTNNQQDVTVGTEYRLIASIKSHEEISGIKTTVLTRAKIYSPEERATLEAEEASGKVAKPRAAKVKSASKDGMTPRMRWRMNNYIC